MAEKIFLSLLLEHLKFPCLTCHIAFQYLAIYGVDSIFASTCLLELKLPNHFQNYTAFDLAMRTVLKVPHSQQLNS